MSGDWNRIDTSVLDPQFFKDAHWLLDNSKGLWVVTEGQRPVARSNDLFIEWKLKNGARAAPGGLSPHNYGMAIDVALDGDELKPGLQALWITTDPRWVSLIANIWKHPRLRSGKWYSDWPHIEKLHWKDYTPWRRVYEDNLTYLRGISDLRPFLPKAA